MKFLIALLIGVFAFAQESYVQEIQEFQSDLNKEFSNPEETPLRGHFFEEFEGLPFFEIDSKYRVEANFVKTENADFIEFPTSSGKSKRYREFGKASFLLDGEEYTLTLFQSEALMNHPKYKDDVFLPFHDATNGETTYGGGRYLDLKIPESDKMIIDFNKAYHPFCAYNAFDYSCPIVPQENILPIPIPAGIRYQDIYFD